MNSEHTGACIDPDGRQLHYTPMTILQPPGNPHAVALEDCDVVIAPADESNWRQMLLTLAGCEFGTTTKALVSATLATKPPFLPPIRLAAAAVT